MKQHRFIRFLGREIDAVGSNVEDVLEQVSGPNDSNPMAADWTHSAQSTTRVHRAVADRIATRLDGQTKDGVEFFSRGIANQTRDSEAAVYGADLAVVFEVDLPEYSVAKSVLVRNSILQAGAEQDRETLDQLEAAAVKMLGQSADSFVFSYPVDGEVKVVPASAIKALADAGASVPRTFPNEFYVKSIGRFFEELAQCFIGDHTLIPAATDAKSWEEKRRHYLAAMKKLDLSTLLYVRVRQSDRDARLDEF